MPVYIATTIRTRREKKDSHIIYHVISLKALYRSTTRHTPEKEKEDAYIVVGPIREWYTSWATHTALHCSSPSWVSGQSAALQRTALFSLQILLRQHLNPWASNPRYHGVTGGGPGKRSRRKPCLEPRRSGAREQ